MRSTRIRLQLAALIFILAPATAGVVAVHASATCERFVRSYVTKPVRNRVSKATADAWAAWREAHPNWKPNPNLHRPKYVMTREEQVKKIEFACEVPTIPSTEAIFFKTAEVEPPPMIELPSMSTETGMPELPTQVAEVTPAPALGTFVLPPVAAIPAITAGVPGPTPEPACIVMAGSGVAGLLLAGKRRGRRRAAARNPLNHPRHL